MPRLLKGFAINSLIYIPPRAADMHLECMESKECHKKNTFIQRIRKYRWISKEEYISMWTKYVISYEGFKKKKKLCFFICLFFKYQGAQAEKLIPGLMSSALLCVCDDDDIWKWLKIICLKIINSGMTDSGNHKRGKRFFSFLCLSFKVKYNSVQMRKISFIFLICPRFIFFHGAGLQAAPETWGSYLSCSVDTDDRLCCIATGQCLIWLTARERTRVVQYRTAPLFFWHLWVISQSLLLWAVLIYRLSIGHIFQCWLETGLMGNLGAFPISLLLFFFYLEKNTVVFWCNADMIRWLAASQRFHFLQAVDHLASLACCMLHRIQGRKQISLSTETALAADDEQCRQDNMNQSCNASHNWLSVNQCASYFQTFFFDDIDAMNFYCFFRLLFYF